MAQARKVRDRRFPRAEFEIPVADAVNALLRARDIEPGDEWSFHASGETLIITRTRPPQEEPIDPEGDATAGGPGRSR